MKRRRALFLLVIIAFGAAAYGWTTWPLTLRDRVLRQLREGEPHRLNRYLNAPAVWKTGDQTATLIDSNDSELALSVFSWKKLGEMAETLPRSTRDLLEGRLTIQSRTTVSFHLEPRITIEIHLGRIRITWENEYMLQDADLIEFE